MFKELQNIKVSKYYFLLTRHVFCETNKNMFFYEFIFLCFLSPPAHNHRLHQKASACYALLQNQSTDMEVTNNEDNDHVFATSSP